MMFRRLLSIFLFAWAFSCRLPAQIAASQTESTSPRPPSKSQTIEMTVPNGTPLQIALDKEVRVRKVGEPITGRVMQPVYVFDRLVIPVGTAATGRISAIDPVPGRMRTLDALNADFTPAHKLTVAFDELILPDGRHIDLHATVVPGSGQVIRLVTTDEHKKNVVKDAAAQKMDQARAQWNNAMKQVESPGRAHLVTRYAVAQLPVHPQYIDAGTLYSAEVSQPLDFGSESLSSDILSAIGTQPPTGSLVHAVLLTPLNSATTLKSADVTAELSQPLLDQGRLILPAGTRLRGSVLQVRPARRLHRNGQLRIAFREAIGAGTIDVFQELDADHYRSLGTVAAGAGAKTARLAAPINRYFVAVPQANGGEASVQVFQPLNTPAPKQAANAEVPQTVDAPRALQLELATMSAHPDLRKMGLHAVPPGAKESVIIANTNTSRIGYKSSQGDLDAVKDGKTYCAKRDDGAFFNVKTPPGASSEFL
jgi:hypothetical protein